MTVQTVVERLKEYPVEDGVIIITDPKMRGTNVGRPAWFDSFEQPVIDAALKQVGISQKGDFVVRIPPEYHHPRT